jgi:DHA2 family multidrug resistance protein
MFVGSLLVATYLMHARNLPPIATVPFGILLVMIAMWMLSGSTSESGPGDMMAAVLLRGFGLGFLFLSITLVAFGGLDDRHRADGIGLFDTGRQLGGLIGVAGLQTLIEHKVVSNAVVIGSHVTAGVAAVSERLTITASILVDRGVDALAAGRASIALLNKAVNVQATVIAFDTAFAIVALLFVVAAPVLIAFKIGLSRAAKPIANCGMVAQSWSGKMAPGTRSDRIGSPPSCGHVNCEASCSHRSTTTSPAGWAQQISTFPSAGGSIGSGW